VESNLGASLTIVLDHNGNELCRLFRASGGQPAVHGAELQRLLLAYDYRAHLERARDLDPEGFAVDVETRAVANHIIAHFRDGILVTGCPRSALVYTIHPQPFTANEAQLRMKLQAGRLDGTTFQEHMESISDDCPIEDFVPEADQMLYDAVKDTLPNDWAPLEAEIFESPESQLHRTLIKPTQIRINELARELGVNVLAIIEYLPETGITEKTYLSSAVDVGTAEKVRKHFHNLAEIEVSAEKHAKEAASEADRVEPLADSVPPQVPHDSGQASANGIKDSHARGSGLPKKKTLRIWTLLILVWFLVAILATMDDEVWLSHKMMEPLYLAVWAIVAWSLAKWIQENRIALPGTLRTKSEIGKKRSDPYVRGGVVLTQELVTSLDLVGWQELVPSYTPDEVAAIDQELRSVQRIADDVAKERWGAGSTMVVNPHVLPDIQRMYVAIALRDLAYYQWFFEDELPPNWKDLVSTYLKAWTVKLDPNHLVELAELLIRAGHRSEAKQAYQVVLLFPTYADIYFAKQQTPELVDGIVNRAKEALNEL
jgi:hypothetical protein